MRRFALLLVAGAPALVAAPLSPLVGQGFGVYEHNTCTMARAGVAAASPCADGSAIFFSPAGLAGMAGNHFSVGVTAIAATGNFTDDLLAHRTALDNPVIPVPNAYLTHQFSPKLTAGIGVYAPYGLETRWPVAGFEGRFLGYNTDVRSIYIQPTVGYQVHPRLKIGVGVAYITSHLKLRQRQDLSTVPLPANLLARDVGDADADLEARVHLITDRGLDVDRSHVGVVAEESSFESCDRPPGLEAIRGVDADARREFRAELMRQVGVGNGDDGVVEGGAVGQQIIGEVARRGNRRDADAEVVSRQARQPRRTEEDRKSVGARTCRGDAGAGHCAGVVLVDAEPLPNEGGKGGGDKRRGPGDQQQRKPPHTCSPSDE